MDFSTASNERVLCAASQLLMVGLLYYLEWSWSPERSSSTFLPEPWVHYDLLEAEIGEEVAWKRGTRLD